MKKFIFILLLLICLSVYAEYTEAESGWKDGILRHKSKDNDFMLRLDMRLYLDYTRYFEEDNYLSDGSNLRKARLAFKTQLWKKWKAEFDLDFADNSVEIKDMWALYAPLSNISVKLGHYKVPFSLEGLTSSRYISFMERATMNTFSPGRKMAAGLSWWSKYGTISAAVHGQSIDTDKNKSRDEGYGYAGRITGLPYNSDRTILHLGMCTSWVTPDNGRGILEFKEEPEAKQGDSEFLDTAEISKVKNSAVYDLEAALSWHSLHLQAEYSICRVNRERGFEDYEFSGGYAFLSWLISGESRTYSKEEGEFGEILPTHSYGALEAAFRYSHLDLSDYQIQDTEYVGITGGLANIFTGGLTWYFNPNYKLLINYSYVDNSHHASGDGDYPADYNFSILQTRLLVQF